MRRCKTTSRKTLRPGSLDRPVFLPSLEHAVHAFFDLRHGWLDVLFECTLELCLPKMLAVFAGES